MTKRAGRKHWYFIYWDYCVLGGHTDVARVRRYTKRPKLWKNRHKIEESVCYSCMYGSFG